MAVIWALWVAGSSPAWFPNTEALEGPMPSPKLTAAQDHARELLHQACVAVEKANTHDIPALDEAFRLAIAAAAAGREVLRPSAGPLVQVGP